MKTIELNGKKYICPEKWSDITLKQQMKVSEDNDKITIPELKKFAILSGYCNIPIEELKHAKLTELTELFKNMAFINEELPNKAIIEFDFNGKHYFVGQNLVEMEFQDFISIENTIQQHSGNTVQSLPVILAIMCKQRKENGIFETIDDYDVQKRAEEFLDLPLTIANSISLFFSANEVIFSKIIPSFLKPEVQKGQMLKQLNSVENTLKELDGKGLLTRCVTGILRYYSKSIKRKLDKHYTSIL